MMRPLVIAAVVLVTLTGCAPPHGRVVAPDLSSSSRHTEALADTYVAPTAAEIAELPEARYDTVIPALREQSTVLDLAHTAYSLAADAALYGTRGGVPIARIDSANFLGEPTVVVPVEIRRRWSLVLTPARRALPSANGGRAAAQTSAWIRTDLLVKPVRLSNRIVVSLSARTLTVVSVGGEGKHFAIAIGASSTPTPTGVTGYLQARYLDPSQAQREFEIQLTSLHSPTADEPFGGSDGGLIGVHYEKSSSGAISHGCIRVTVDAIEAITALPLGTLITIVS
jgi:hypothetical protein